MFDPPLRQLIRVIRRWWPIKCLTYTDASHTIQKQVNHFLVLISLRHNYFMDPYRVMVGVSSKICSQIIIYRYKAKIVYSCAINEFSICSSSVQLYCAGHSRPARHWHEKLAAIWAPPCRWWWETVGPVSQIPTACKGTVMNCLQCSADTTQI